MDKTLKLAHLVGLALFLGSVAGHILLYVLAVRAADLQSFAVLMQAKYMSVRVLTLPALVFTLVTGVPLMVRQQLTPNKAKWMAAKLALVALITLNGIFVLLPVARDLAASAQTAAMTGSIPASFAELERRETLFGDVNLAMILAVIGLSVLRPGTRTGEAKRGEALS